MTTEKPSLRRQAYEAIHRWITDGTLPRGGVASEVRLSALLDMSRTPVRAALQQLEHEGYVRIVPKHGILILDSSSQRVADLLDMIASMLLFTVAQLWQADRQDELREFAERQLAKWRERTGEAAGNGEAQIQFEHEFLHGLLSMGCNAEMLRQFQLAASRLYWRNNRRRWAVPYFSATRDRLLDLIRALPAGPDDFRGALFPYVHTLKRTWS